MASHTGTQVDGHESTDLCDDVAVAAEICIGVVDDHWAISAGVLAELRELIAVGAGSQHAGTVAELLACGVPMRVVVLDVDLRDGTNATCNVAQLAERGVGVVVYTQERRPTVLSRCLQSGALALINKGDPPEVLAEAVKSVARGEPFLNADWALVVEWMEGDKIPRLSPREAEVLSLFASGLPLKSVARRLGIASETAKEHLDRIRGKYSLAGRPAGTKSELYFRGVEDGHIPLPTDY